MTRLRIAWLAGASDHPLPFAERARMLVAAWSAGRRARRRARESARRAAAERADSRGEDRSC